MRVVLDTKVLISALLFGGLPREILRECVRGEPQLMLSDTMLDELHGVLRRERFGLSARRVGAIVNEVAEIAEIVTTTSKVSAITDDLADNAVLECALDGRADHVVSGDRHLLELRDLGGIRMLNPRDYVDSQLRRRP
jgi:uncharacterized protein